MNDKQNSSVRFSYDNKGVMVLHFEGDWVLRSGMPDAYIVEAELKSRQDIKKLSFDVTAFGAWDTSLLAFVIKLDKVCEQAKLNVDYSKLPDGVRGLLSLAKAVPERQGARRQGENASVVRRLGEFVFRSIDTFQDGLKFVGETIIAVGNIITTQTTTTIVENRINAILPIFINFSR